MSCCCTKTLELCRVSICGTDNIITGANAPEGGNFKLVLDYLDVDVVINKTQVNGQPLNFPSAGLNENYKYTGKIIGPTGDPVTLTIDEIVYDCISFQTGLSYNLTEEEVVEEAP